MKLEGKDDVEEIQLWGKIIGTVKDYYIAMGIKYKGQYEFPIKKFYWANNSFIFSELPELNLQHIKHADSQTDFFTGEPEKVLVTLQKEGEEGEEEEQKEKEEEEEQKEKKDDLSDTSEEQEIIIPPKNFTELDRLAFTVRAIENDCDVVPEGSFKLTPIHEVRRNNAFKGIKMGELNDLKKYQHFRKVQTDEKKEFIERDDAIFYPNFLDSLDGDLPQGCWSIHLDPSKTFATVRSLLWPGYVFYHISHTKQFGSLYIGEGNKNKDLPFML